MSKTFEQGKDEVAKLCEYFAKNQAAFCAPGRKEGGGLFRGGYYAFSRQYIEALPVRTIDPANNDDNAAHDRLVKLVASMLDLHKQLSSAKGEAQRGAIERQIDATDREIDRLVYDSYGLTKEEIAIVEGASA